MTAPRKHHHIAAQRGRLSRPGTHVSPWYVVARVSSCSCHALDTIHNCTMCNAALARAICIIRNDGNLVEGSNPVSIPVLTFPSGARRPHLCGRAAETTTNRQSQIPSSAPHYPAAPRRPDARGLLPPCPGVISVQSVCCVGVSACPLSQCRANQNRSVRPRQFPRRQSIAPKISGVPGAQNSSPTCATCCGPTRPPSSLRSARAHRSACAATGLPDRMRRTGARSAPCSPSCSCGSNESSVLSLAQTYLTVRAYRVSTPVIVP